MNPTADNPDVSFEAVSDGGNVTLGDGGAERRYELRGVERPSPSRLRATVRAFAAGGGSAARFVVETLDFYSLRSRRGFVAEVARLFGEPVAAIEADMNRLTIAAESCVEGRTGGASEPVAKPDHAACVEGIRFGRSADLIGEIQRDLDRIGIVGECNNRLLLYLAMTSRKLDEPLAVQILSSSGAGKSHLQDAVLSLCPPEDLVSLTSLTSRALFYKAGDALKHKVLAIAEAAGADGARYALRSLISERRLVVECTAKNPVTGRLETHVNTVHGPTAVFETTTQPGTDAETTSRYIVLAVDESPEQTRAILAAQRQVHTIEGRRRRAARAAIIERHHAFQRSLRPLTVVNPFEPLLACVNDAALPLRRDYPKYLALILAVTLLHQHQRSVRHDAAIGDFIETTLEDIAVANALAPELLRSDIDELSAPGRELLRLIGEFVASRTAEVEWTRRELREAIGWTEARLRLHLSELVRLDYVVPLAGRWGRRFIYRLALSPAQTAAGAAPVAGIKDVEALRRDAVLADIAETSQPPSCEVEPVANPHEYRVPDRTGCDFASFAGENIEESCGDERKLISAIGGS